MSGKIAARIVMRKKRKDRIFAVRIRNAIMPYPPPGKGKDGTKEPKK
jgi:hypothetical protein